MINLNKLCFDLSNHNSSVHDSIKVHISTILSQFENSSYQTQELFEYWAREFQYVYGDVSLNLSSNNKLNINKMLLDYNIYSDENSLEQSFLRLFFCIQTYLSIFVKLLMCRIFLDDDTFSKYSYSEKLDGTVFKIFGIKNYYNLDWYAWPIFELDHISEEIEMIEDFLSQYACDDEDLNSIDCINIDYFKKIYENIIPKPMRHALGEYYTPEWLCSLDIHNCLSFTNNKSIKNLSIVDPTCGSGTFLVDVISQKVRLGVNLQSILDTVVGIDINPLSVFIAKTNYLLAIKDLIVGAKDLNIILPIYNIDVLQLFDETCSMLICNDTNNKIVDIINMTRNNDFRSICSMRKFDVVIGNPPWVNWEYLSPKYRNKTKHIWVKYGLFDLKGIDLGFSKEDISVLITYVVIDTLLKDTGIIGFVIRQAIFKSKLNGYNFRKFCIRGVSNFKILRVDDLSNIKVFSGATNSTAVFYAKKGTKNIYPVPYFVWRKRSDLQRMKISEFSKIQEVMDQIEISEEIATPSDKNDISSLWFTSKQENLSNLSKALGNNSYRARTGVFTGGANAVYWVQIDSCDNNIKIHNLIGRAKRKTDEVNAVIEKDFVFPLLKGSNIDKWSISYNTYILCPHTHTSKMWPVDKDELKTSYPLTYEYLLHFKNFLDTRKGFAGWEKEIQKEQFHAILRVGDYTFCKYKVVWKYIAKDFICSVVSNVSDKYLGSKMIVPNEKVMYVGIDDEEEAYYLCGILSSSLVSECVKSFMTPTSISAHVLDKLNIPTFDRKNKIHREISKICKRGHKNTSYNKEIKKIDELVNDIY